MSRGVKIIILVAAGTLIIVVGIILFLKLGSSTTKTNTNTPAYGNLPQGSHLVINDNIQVKSGGDETVITPEKQVQISLERRSFDYAEKLGSYSNQNGFKNIIDLQPFMTDSMKKWSVDFIKNHFTDSSKAYSGTVTRSLTLKSEDVGESVATLIVATQRKETSAAGERIYNQDAKVVFKKTNNQWLLDQLAWQ